MLFLHWARTNMAISMWVIPKLHFFQSSDLEQVFFGTYPKPMNWRQDIDFCNFLTPHTSSQVLPENTSATGGSTSDSTLSREKTALRQVPIFRPDIISMDLKTFSVFSYQQEFLLMKKPGISNPNCSIPTGQGSATSISGHPGGWVLDL